MNKYDFKMELRRKIIRKKKTRIFKISNMVGITNRST
jgi:hypothetical protein